MTRVGYEFGQVGGAKGGASISPKPASLTGYLCVILYAMYRVISLLVQRKNSVVIIQCPAALIFCRCSSIWLIDTRPKISFRGDHPVSLALL